VLHIAECIYSPPSTDTDPSSIDWIYPAAFLGTIQRCWINTRLKTLSVCHHWSA